MGQKGMREVSIKLGWTGGAWAVAAHLGVAAAVAAKLDPYARRMATAARSPAAP